MVDMTCRHLTTLRRLRDQLSGLDLDGEAACCPEPGPVVAPDPVLPPKPFFGGRWAPWAIPSAQIDDHPQAGKFVAEFHRMCSGEINLNTHAWAIAKYFFDEHTPRARLDIRRPDWCNLDDGGLIPWNPSWRHADDGDSYVMLVEKRTGRCYLIWQTRYDASRNLMRCGTANIVLAGVRRQGIWAS